MFISIAFCVDAGRDVYKNFQRYYYASECLPPSAEALGSLLKSANNTTEALLGALPQCRRENSLLFLLLMLGTVWLAVSLYNFNKTPYLQASKREMLADYALPVAVIALSFLGAFVFREVESECLRSAVIPAPETLFYQNRKCKKFIL